MIMKPGILTGLQILLRRLDDEKTHPLGPPLLKKERGKTLITFFPYFTPPLQGEGLGERSLRTDRMDKTDYTILLVDDEPDILEFVGYNIKKEGYALLTASNGRDAIELAKKSLPHLIILDIMMPGMDGIEVCSELRKIPELNHVLIAFLTARGEDFTQIAGLDAGGDDYITKPIKPRVLMSRVNALLRRHPSDKSKDLKTTVGNTVIDRERYMIIKNGQDISFPRKEFELLALLMSKPNKVFSREEIFEAVWSDDVVVGDRTIDVHIRRIREKLNDENIKTIKGVGYKYEFLT
jgi:two-component system, OmpR family, alkaline phosphatase synthesis response regulator PhoP